MKAQDYVSNDGRTELKIETGNDGTYMIIMIRDGEIVGALNRDTIASSNVILEMLKTAYRYGYGEGENAT